MLSLYQKTWQVSSKSNLNPTINTLWRFCGQPKFLVFKTSKSIAYPHEQSSSQILSMLLPPSCESNPLTFSNKKYFGCFALSILVHSNHIFPRGSSNPPRFPAILHDWQGTPPQTRSKSGRLSALIFVMSP